MGTYVLRACIVVQVVTRFCLACSVIVVGARNTQSPHAVGRGWRLWTGRRSNPTRCNCKHTRTHIIKGRPGMSCTSDAAVAWQGIMFINLLNNISKIGCFPPTRINVEEADCTSWRAYLRRPDISAPYRTSCIQLVGHVPRARAAVQL